MSSSGHPVAALWASTVRVAAAAVIRTRESSSGRRGRRVPAPVSVLLVMEPGTGVASVAGKDASVGVADAPEGDGSDGGLDGAGWQLPSAKASRKVTPTIERI